MSNPLDSVWDAYTTATSALKVARRCAAIGEVASEPLLRDTRFCACDASTCESLLESAREQIDDQTVLALYAVFEAALRDYLTQQAILLHQAKQPHPQFGQELAVLFDGYCGDVRMDAVEKLFLAAVGVHLVATAGSIRVYRHWIAHGRRWAAPPTVVPQFAYRALTQFLQASGLA